MKTIHVRTTKPGMVLPLVPDVGHNTTAKAITHEEPVEVIVSAFIQRRIAKGDLVEVTPAKAGKADTASDSPKKRETKSSKPRKEG